MEEYIQKNNLKDSHIDAKKLYQYRPTLPARINIGTKDNYLLFFEETASSLVKRHYGYSDRILRYKLVSNGKEVTDTNNIVITNNNYDMDFLTKFINTKDKNVNLLEPRTWQRGRKKSTAGSRKRQILCTDEEYIYIKEFIQKLREELKK